MGNWTDLEYPPEHPQRTLAGFVLIVTRGSEHERAGLHELPMIEGECTWRREGGSSSDRSRGRVHDPTSPTSYV